MKGAESRPSFVRGSLTVLLGQFLYVCVTLLSVVVLSRLLPPADFGLIAMVGVLLALGEQLRDLGIATSALRSPKLSNTQASNLFWVGFALSAIVTLILALGAPVVADIYGEPRLRQITPVLAVTMLLNGMQSQFQVQLARSHKYVALAYVNVAANIAGVTVAILAALSGWGYWALVAQSIMFSLVGLVLRVHAARWRPLLLRRRVGTKGLLLDGVNYSASSLANYASRNVDVFMLGLRSDAAGVGQYSRANQFVALVSSLVASLTNVAVPVLTADKQRAEDVTGSAIRIQSMVVIPLAFVFSSMAVCASTFIPMVIGPGWDAAVPFLKVLCLGGLGYGLFYVNHWIFLVMLTSRNMLGYSMVGQAVAVGLIVLGSFHSPIGTAAGVAAGQLALWLIGFVWLTRCSAINAAALLLNGLRLVAAAFVTFAVASWVLAAIPHGAGIGALFVELVCVGLMFAGLLSGTRRGRRELHQGLMAMRRVWGGVWAGARRRRFK